VHAFLSRKGWKEKREGSLVELDAFAAPGGGRGVFCRGKKRDKGGELPHPFRTREKMREHPYLSFQRGRKKEGHKGGR